MTMDDTPAQKTELNPALVERDQEMRFLDQQMDQASHAMGGVVFVSGEPGVGKTRLMDEAEALAQERGMLFLRGTGEARRAGMAYGVVAEELGRCLEHVSETEGVQLREAVAELAPHLWSCLFPTEECPPTPDGEVSPQLRQSLFLARLGRLLLDLARRRPLVLCLEDLHWADSASLQLVAYLTSRNAEVPLLILTTYRPGQQDGLDLEETLRELQLRRHLHMLTLKPLSSAGTRAMAASCFGRQGLSEKLLQWLHRKSGGVPFFSIQFLEFCLEKGVIYERDGLWVDRTPKDEKEPDSVRAVLRQRLQNLAPEELKVLGCAAVQGDRFEGRLVARALGVPFVRVMRTLAELVRRTRLVRAEERRFCFAHAMLTEVLYEQLSVDERRWMHLRLGRILEEQGPGDVEVLAHHYYRAGSFARAVPHLLESARRAHGAFAFREALGFLDQTKVAMGGTASGGVQLQRQEMLLTRADIEDRTGRPAKALELCRQVLELAAPTEDRSMVGRSLLLMGWVQFRKGEWEEAISLHQGAHEIFEELGDDLRCAQVHLRLGAIAFERGQLDEAEARYRDAKSVAIRHASHSMLGTVSGNLAVLATVRGCYLDAVLGYTDALKAYKRVGNTYGLCQTYHNLGMANAAQEEWDEAIQCYERGRALAREMGTIDTEANIMISLAPSRMALGDLEGAEDMCRQARTHMEQLGDRPGLAECDKVEGMIYRERSQYVEAQEHLELGRHRFEELEIALGVAECDLELGRLFRVSGEVEQARLRLQESQRIFGEIGAAVDANRAEAMLSELAS
jgi:tetratricopeptide (TPR) repeat protein